MACVAIATQHKFPKDNVAHGLCTSGSKDCCPVPSSGKLVMINRAASCSLVALQLVLGCGLICQVLAIGDFGNDAETCVQGFAPAKRTLQATQRDSQRTVMSSAEQKNVLGGKLECCCTKPMTGFYRDGYCRVGPEDHGVHSVCSEMTAEFLEFSASRGNDLRGVVSAGERWCLCVSRWKEALDAGKAPPIVLESCSEEALKVVSMDQLKQHALQSAQ